MSGKRPIVLMGVLLVLLAGYVAKPIWAPLLDIEGSPSVKPLPGESRISALDIRQDADGRWLADIEYFFNGVTPVAHLRVHVVEKANGAPMPPGGGSFSAMKRAERGSHRVTLEMQRGGLALKAVTTERVLVELYTNQLVARLERDQRIDWPDYETWRLSQELAGKSKEEVLKQAARLIDTGERPSVMKGRQVLERLLARHPDYAAGYIEMARVVMKTNWGPQGLHQAETFLSSALRLEADSANAKILLGYVYAHQGRHTDSERLFVEAAAVAPPNQWLWVNWGEVLVMQGKTGAAIEKYRSVLARPRTDDTQDRPRLAAYEQLLAQLGQRRDLDGMEAVLQQRATEFGEASCHGAAHARFVLTQRGNASKATAMARKALEGGCGTHEPREILGMAHYAQWANGDGVERETSLNQARVFLPASARQMYLLATSDPTAKALRLLIAGGERIDRQDDQRDNALSHALHNQDHAAVRRLVRLGARLDSPIGTDDLPVALLPVVTRDFAAIRLMQQLGVDYSQLRHRGLTAIDHARQAGDQTLLKALGGGSDRL